MKILSKRLEDEKVRKPTGVQTFFILCSGAEKELLKDCPTEWNKYAGVGATIFLTACLALLSGAYAMNFIFDNGLYSILFGMFWAMVIFNLDRYIVLSLRKDKMPSISEIERETDTVRKNFLTSERKRLWWNQFYMAAPRFIIAFIIAVTVSKPIELRMFNNRIEKELQNIVKTEDKRFEDDEKRRQDSLKNQLAALNEQEQADKDKIFNRNPIYAEAKERLPRIESDITQKQELIKANADIINKNQVREPRSRIRIIDNERVREEYTVWVPNATAKAKMDENRSLQQEKRRLETERNSLAAKKNAVETTLVKESQAIAENYKTLKENVTAQIEQLKQTYTIRKTAWTNANQRSTDLPARLEALGNISKFDLKPGQPDFLGNSIWWASVVITLLFIALETAPVVVKLLTKRGPYDEKLDAEEYRVFIEESKKVDTLNREINDYMQLANDASKLSGSLRLAAEKDKLDTELTNNKALLTKLADYQKQLADIYAEAWFQEEKAKAEQHVKGYYQQSHQKNRLEGSFWRQKGAADRIEYFFRNHASDNELLYFENGDMNKGKWIYDPEQNELTIDIVGHQTRYGIFEVNDQCLKLVEKTSNDVLELEKA